MIKIAMVGAGSAVFLKNLLTDILDFPELRQVKIAAAILFAAALAGSFLVLFVGADVLGARRELNMGLLTLQPSEFLKPSFAIVVHTIQYGCLQSPLTASSPENCLGQGVMPAGIVRGQDVQQVAAFVAKFAGTQ